MMLVEATVKAGELMTVQDSKGGTFHLRVPANVVVGQKLQVQLPAESAPVAAAAAGTVAEVMAAAVERVAVAGDEFKRTCWGSILSNGYTKCTPGFSAKPGHFSTLHAPRGLELRAARACSHRPTYNVYVSRVPQRTSSAPHAGRRASQSRLSAFCISCRALSRVPSRVPSPSSISSTRAHTAAGPTETEQTSA